MIATPTVKTEFFKEELRTRGSFPSKIECDDGNIYIVKHSQIGQNYKQLINEFIAAHLAKFIGVTIPDFALIKIDEEILPRSVKFERGKPKGLGFGSKFLHGTIKEFSSNTKYSELRKISKLPLDRDFTAICIFDVWLRNSDRNVNNCNLLIHETVENIKLIAIDHASIFAETNYLRLENEKNELPPIGETLIYHDFFSEMYYDSGIFFEEIKDEVLRKINDVSDKRIIEIVESLPREWRISAAEKESISDFIIHRRNILEQQINSVIIDAGF